MLVAGRWVVPSLTVLVLCCGCGSHANRTAADRRIDAAGHIGPLRLDHSKRHDVIAFAGHPEAEWRWPGTGGSAAASGYPPYRALGYDCAGNVAPTRVLPSGAYPDSYLPDCRTIFFGNSKTANLMSFLTADPRYSESLGVRVGMSTAIAERLLHNRVSAIGRHCA